MKNGKKEYTVIHPLDDIQEEKIDVRQMGKLKMTRVMKYSLLVLRFYLIFMLLLVLYRVILLAGWL